jgi:hypothetical protein
MGGISRRVQTNPLLVHEENTVNMKISQELKDERADFVLI